MARPRAAGGLRQAPILTAVLAACWTAACTPAGSRPAAVSWTLEPAAPVVGAPARAILKLGDPDGRPLAGADLQIEAHMTHPGMAPVVGAASETAPGTYEAEITFTMAGPWSLVASGVLADGRRLTETYEIEEVR